MSVRLAPPPVPLSLWMSSVLAPDFLDELRMDEFRLDEFRLDEFRLDEFRLDEFRLG